MDNNQLKSLALLDSIGKNTQRYENELSDARVEVTVLTQRVNELTSEVTAKQARIEELEQTIAEMNQPDVLPEEDAPASE